MLHAHEHRFDTALHNMLQGLLMIGQSGELVVVNRRFNELFDMPEGVLAPGMTYQELTERVVEFGNVCDEDMCGMRERREVLLERNERTTRHLEPHRRPRLQRDASADGGRLAYHV